MRLSMERLRGLEVVTDAGTAELSVDQLLDEPLGKVRERTVVDTAAVLLLDPSGQFLVVTVARGSRRRSTRACGSRSVAASPAHHRGEALGRDRAG